MHKIVHLTVNGILKLMKYSNRGIQRKSRESVCWREVGEEGGGFVCVCVCARAESTEETTGAESRISQHLPGRYR